jgi:methionyl-tRNA formyltransferase
MKPLRLAIFGQAPFGREVTEKLADAGHEIVAVYAPPDTGRPDPLAELAGERSWPLYRYKRFRSKGKAIQEIVEEYRKLAPDLNVLPFTTTILPPEIVDAPPHGSLCFHPSLLPAYRGGAALSWQIILGAQESGVSVFRVTDGVDAGPLVIQRGGVPIEPGDTMGSLYFDKLYAMGVDAMVDGVAKIADGTTEFPAQSEDGASEQGLINDEVARIDWSRSAVEIDRLIRGCDPSPGALAQLAGDPVRLYGGALVSSETGADAAPGSILELVDGGIRVAASPGIVSIGKLKLAGAKKCPAAEAGLKPGDRLL